MKEYFAETGLIPTATLKRLCDEIFQQAPSLGNSLSIPLLLLPPVATLPPILAAARRGFAGRDAIRQSLQLPINELIVLLGRPGIGKTALLGELGKEFLGIGNPEIQRVVYCQCEPTEQAGLSPLRVGLGLLASDASRDWDQQIDELLQTLEISLESSGIALFVDDVHWADEPTMRFLRRLSSLERKPNFAIICAGWSTEKTEALCTVPTVRRIHLHPCQRRSIPAVVGGLCRSYPAVGCRSYPAVSG